MPQNLLTNTWYSAALHHPWRECRALLRFADGHEAVGIWNGLYWVGQHRMRFSSGDTVAAFYIYDTYNPDDLY